MANRDDEGELSRLLGQPQQISEQAPASLKARLYSALVREQQTTGPLASLNETLAAGHGICVFEKLVQIAPLGENTKSRFICHVCHARALGERFDRAPIYWPHCPYVNFKS